MPPVATLAVAADRHDVVAVATRSVVADAAGLPVAVSVFVPSRVSVRIDDPLLVAEPRTLRVGEAAMYLAGEASCNEYPVTGGTYLITAFNYNALLTTRASFQLVGASKAPATAASASLRAVPSVAAVPSFGPLASQAVPSSERFDRGHLAMLEANRQLLERKGSPASAMRAKRSRERAKLRVSPRAGGAPVGCCLLSDWTTATSCQT